MELSCFVGGATLQWCSVSCGWSFLVSWEELHCSGVVSCGWSFLVSWEELHCSGVVSLVGGAFLFCGRSYIAVV